MMSFLKRWGTSCGFFSCTGGLESGCCVSSMVLAIHIYESHLLPPLSHSFSLSFSLSLSPANAVVRNKRPQMMKPTGSHSTYHALRGQTVELECIVQGLWVSVCVYVFVSMCMYCHHLKPCLPLHLIQRPLLPLLPLLMLLSSSPLLISLPALLFALNFLETLYRPFPFHLSCPTEYY